MSDQNEKPIPSDDFERTLDLLKAGYKNAQEVIRFIDTKTNIYIISSVSLSAFVFNKIMNDMKVEEFCGNDFCLGSAILLLGLFFLFSFLCVSNGYLSIKPKTPSREHKATMILFPFDKNEISDVEINILCRNGLSERFVLKDYFLQIDNVRAILRKKFSYNHRCLDRLMGQIVFFIIFIFLYFVFIKPL